MTTCKSESKTVVNLCKSHSNTDFVRHQNDHGKSSRHHPQNIAIWNLLVGLHTVTIQSFMLELGI